MEIIERVITLVNKGYSQRKIADILNISRWQIRKIIQYNNIELKFKRYDNAKIGSKNIEDRAKEFNKRLKQKDSTKEYVSGYINGDSRVKIRCLRCGTVYEVGANIVRCNTKAKIQCRGCSKLEVQKKQDKKKKELAIRAEQKNRKTKANKLLNNSKQIVFSICENCGELFIGNTKYCGKICSTKHHQREKSRLRLERAKENGYVDYSISLDKLIKRDNNICYICNRECNILDYTYRGNIFVAGNYYPSIDHVIPLAKGGTHEWNNVKLAHRICNSLKRDT